MDWLTRLPIVGPVLARILRSRPYRVFEYVNEVGSSRLAGAVTFFGFLAMFPLLTVAMATTAALLGDRRLHELQTKIQEQLPSLGSSLDLQSLARNAGTVGVVGGALLLVSGLGWVDATRVSIRTLWQLPVEPGNALVRKALDVGVLVGLGLVAAVSIGASSVTSELAGQVAKGLGIEHSAVGRVLLGVVAFVIAVGADLLLFAYLLVGLPRIREQRKRVVVEGALLGAVGFELLKLLLSTYLSHVAGRSMYGTFGTPIALLLWINFVCRWLFYCAAWTATDDPAATAARARARAAEAWHAAGGAGAPGPAPTPSGVEGPTGPDGAARVGAPPRVAAPGGASRRASPARPAGRAALAAAFASGVAAASGIRLVRALRRDRSR